MKGTDSPFSSRNQAIITTRSLNIHHNSPKKLILSKLPLKLTNHTNSLKTTRNLSSFVEMIMDKQKKESNQFYKVRLKIKSNHGSNEFIRYSKIDLFDIDKNRLKIHKIEVFLQYDSSLIIQSKDFLKCDANGWYCQWNDIPITIVFTVNSKLPIEFMRILCDSEHPDENIKDIEIMIGNKTVSRSVVPREIGANIVLRIVDCIPTSVPKISKREGLFIRDKYGEIPSSIVRTLEIDLVGTKKGETGLNQLEIYDISGNKIIPDDKNIVATSSGTVCPYPIMNLFKEDKYTTDCSKMWEAGFKTDYATIKLEFQRPASIYMIKIYNHNSCYDRTLYPTERGRIRINGHTLWVGKIIKAHGTMNKISHYATKIFLSDSPRISEKPREE